MVLVFGFFSFVFSSFVGLSLHSLSRLSSSLTTHVHHDSNDHFLDLLPAHRLGKTASKRRRVATCSISLRPRGRALETLVRLPLSLFLPTTTRKMDASISTPITSPWWLQPRYLPWTRRGVTVVAGVFTVGTLGWLGLVSRRPFLLSFFLSSLFQCFQTFLL